MSTKRYIIRLHTDDANARPIVKHVCRTGRTTYASTLPIATLVTGGNVVTYSTEARAYAAYTKLMRRNPKAFRGLREIVAVAG